MGEKSSKTNNSFIAPSPKIVYRNIRIPEGSAVHISTIQPRNRIFINPLPFFFSFLFFLVFIRVNLSQIDDICWGARLQMVLHFLKKKNHVKHVIQISLVFTSCVLCLDILFGGKSLWISSFFLSYGGAIMVNQV